jgi:hypothetical protein
MTTNQPGREAGRSNHNQGGAMADNAVLYSAVYEDVYAALADLDALDELHHLEAIGKYDAAVIDKEDGQPHIVRRADKPAIRVIPEWFGGGILKRKELHAAADQLDNYEAELIVVGEPTLDKAFDRAITRASKTAKQEFDKATDELVKELKDASKESAG